MVQIHRAVHCRLHSPCLWTCLAEFGFFPFLEIAHISLVFARLQVLAHSLAAFLPTGMGLEAPLVEQAEYSSAVLARISDGTQTEMVFAANCCHHLAALSQSIFNSFSQALLR